MQDLTDRVRVLVHSGAQEPGKRLVCKEILYASGQSAGAE
jgi:hypothetical protein